MLNMAELSVFSVWLFGEKKPINQANVREPIILYVYSMSHILISAVSVCFGHHDIRTILYYNATELQ